eukprot:gb/GEZN01011659.1/.p1 GENE.gb/GEZN01011659.1/~~gb/GEZN01011659.1/.p1  ORF type:complete len:353 (+),score=31.04 gb/GEZN01011659.1/:42-1061(+)
MPIKPVRLAHLLVMAILVDFCFVVVVFSKFSPGVPQAAASNTDQSDQPSVTVKRATNFCKNRSGSALAAVVIAHDRANGGGVEDTSSHHKLQWIEGLFPEFEVVIYSSNLNANETQLISRLQNNPAFHLEVYTHVPNFGQEATKYLGYIIEHYECLPEVVAFMHGHDSKSSWHEKNNIIPVKSAAIKQLIHKCKAAPALYHMLSFWENCGNWMVDQKKLRESSVYVDLFKPYIGGGDQVPLLLTPCCSQFVITRNIITKYPKEFYFGLYNFSSRGQNAHGTHYGADAEAEHKKLLLQGNVSAEVLHKAAMKTHYQLQYEISQTFESMWGVIWPPDHRCS